MALSLLATTIRSQVKRLKDNHPTVDDAETFYGLDIDAYSSANPAIDNSVLDPNPLLNTSSSFINGMESLQHNQLTNILSKLLTLLPITGVVDTITSFLSNNVDDLQTTIETLQLTVSPN